MRIFPSFNIEHFSLLNEGRLVKLDLRKALNLKELTILGCYCIENILIEPLNLMNLKSIKIALNIDLAKDAF